MDLSFMSSGMSQAFAWRLSFYILLDLLILWHYKERMKIIWESVWHNMSTKSRYPLWAYLLLPVFAIGLEIILAIPNILTHLVTNPAKTIQDLSQIPEMIVEIIKNIKSQ